MLKASDMEGTTVYVAHGGKVAATDGRGSDDRLVALGKVHRTVFAPGGTRVVGFLVRRPDVAGMLRRADVFVALDSIAPHDAGIRVTRADGTGDAARARLGIDGDAWDACILWVGMDAATESGRELGFVGDATFDATTGAVTSFHIGDGGVATTLVGALEVSAGMLRGYRDGRMVVADAAATGELTGGLAARAGAAAGRAQVEGGKAAAKVGAAAGKAVDKGSRALGRQLGRTRGMFGSFMDEYKKASR